MVRIKKVRLERLNMCTAIRTSGAILDFCHFFQKEFNLNAQNHKEGIFYMCSNTRFLSFFPWGIRSECSTSQLVFCLHEKWRHFLTIFKILTDKGLEKICKNLVLHVKYLLQYTYLTFLNTFFYPNHFYLTVLKSTAIDFISND